MGSGKYRGFIETAAEAAAKAVTVAARVTRAKRIRPFSRAPGSFCSRAHFGHGKSIKAIGRELHVSRKVVRKVLRSEATEFRYERELQPMPRLGAWCSELDRLLAANEARPGRERLMLVRVFKALRDLGYAGGYDAVRR